MPRRSVAFGFIYSRWFLRPLTWGRSVLAHPYFVIANRRTFTGCHWASSSRFLRCRSVPRGRLPVHLSTPPMARRFFRVGRFGCACSFRFALPLAVVQQEVAPCDITYNYRGRRGGGGTVQFSQQLLASLLPVQGGVPPDLGAGSGRR